MKHFGLWMPMCQWKEPTDGLKKGKAEVTINMRDVTCPKCLVKLDKMASERLANEEQEQALQALH